MKRNRPAMTEVSKISAPGEPTEEGIRLALASRTPVALEAGSCKAAAVLVPIFQQEGGWQVLLTRRTSTVDTHKGEISFPGGSMDPGDPDLEATALREAEEEVGIREARLLGRLDDIYTISNFRVTPFVGRIAYPFELRPAPEEIAEVIVLPLAALVAPGCFAEKLLDRAGMAPFPIYFFYVGGYTVWGATAKILKQFLEVCLAFRPPVGQGSLIRPEELPVLKPGQ
jgi:8-oxo-dGTP pyrophosphatase MutT (NUDIX family)